MSNEEEIDFGAFARKARRATKNHKKQLDQTLAPCLSRSPLKPDTSVVAILQEDGSVRYAVVQVFSALHRTPERAAGDAVLNLGKLGDDVISKIEVLSTVLSDFLDQEKTHSWKGTVSELRTKLHHASGNKLAIISKKDSAIIFEKFYSLSKLLKYYGEEVVEYVGKVSGVIMTYTLNGADGKKGTRLDIRKRNKKPLLLEAKNP